MTSHSTNHSPEDSVFRDIVSHDDYCAPKANFSHNIYCSRQRDEKHCAVCGDHAVGYNFGAIACESCKAFFRRNALRPTVRRPMPSCLFRGKCLIQLKTRRFCSPCRLDKCFAVGMKKAGIMDEKAKRERREKIERNRARKSVHQPKLMNTASTLHSPADIDYEGTSGLSADSGSSGGYQKLCFDSSSELNGFVAPACQIDGTLTKVASPSATHSLSSSNGLWNPCYPLKTQQSSKDPRCQRAPETAKSVGASYHSRVGFGARRCPTSSEHSSSHQQEDECSLSQFDLGNSGSSSPPPPSSPSREDSTWNLEALVLAGSLSSAVVTPTDMRGAKGRLSGNCCFEGNFIYYHDDHDDAHRGEYFASRQITECIPEKAVKNVLDGHVWTTVPVEGSSRESISLSPVFLKTGMARLLSQDQWTALNDLRSAYHTSFLHSEADHAPDSGSSLTLSSLVNTSGFLVRKFINFAKKLADFSVLGQEGQVCLLKGVVLNAIFIRSASHYDVSRDVWVTPKGDIPTRILKVATGLEKLYEEHANYCRNFCKIVGRDSHLVALIQVLSLFAPDRPKLLNRQTVSNIYDRYVLLMKHYLEARHGYTRGRALLAAVLTNLAELEALNDNYGHIILHVDPSKVEPLILEVFNLSDRAAVATSVSETLPLSNPDPTFSRPGSSKLEQSDLSYMEPPQKACSSTEMVACTSWSQHGCPHHDCQTVGESPVAPQMPQSTLLPSPVPRNQRFTTEAQ